MIGERIKNARLLLGYSAEQVAEYLGVSPATIYRYENGDIAKLPSKHIKPLAEFLCVSPSYLMGWTDSAFVEPTSAPIDPATAESMSSQARIISGGIDKMPPEKRDQALKILQAAFVEYADYFKEENK